MPGWINPQEAEALDPSFFERRGGNAWTVFPDERAIRSRFGYAEVRVQITDDGMPDFDRAVYGEAPNVNALAWGNEDDGTIKVAVVVQSRPFADNPDGTPANPPYVFGQPAVMAFRQKLLGENLAAAFESGDDTVVRKALEEAGAQGILDVKHMGWHNPNPTFVATWSELFDIQVDLTRLQQEVDSSQLIFRAEYVSIKELLRRIGEGAHENVNYRSATANDTFLVWLARHPEAIVQAI